MPGQAWCRVDRRHPDRRQRQPGGQSQLRSDPRGILAEATTTDEAEDELYGEECGDELPQQLRTPEGRREFLRQAQRERERENEDSGATEPEPEVPLELEAKNVVGRGRQGRDAWLREGKRQLEQHRWENPNAIPRGRPGRLRLAAQRLESDHDVECCSNAAYELYRATARDRLGRRPGGRAEPYRPPQLPAGKVNTTDPDSRPIPIGFGRGYFRTTCQAGYRRCWSRSMWCSQ